MTQITDAYFLCPYDGKKTYVYLGERAGGHARIICHECNREWEMTFEIERVPDPAADGF